MKIGMFDSGIGGLSVLDAIKELLPNAEYIYYADSKNNPYGEKTDEELFRITSNITENLIKQDCKIIVVACNTATTRCIKYLREKYKDIIFVGTEPAIKVACDRNFENILVLATPATIASERTSILVEKNKKEKQKMYLESCSGLANSIETKNIKKQEEIVSAIHEKYKQIPIDAIVLGCTHYCFIRDLIHKYFENAQLLDGNMGVAREVKRQLEKGNLIDTVGNRKNKNN